MFIKKKCLITIRYTIVQCNGSYIIRYWKREESHCHFYMRARLWCLMTEWMLLCWWPRGPVPVLTSPRYLQSPAHAVSLSVLRSRTSTSLAADCLHHWNDIRYRYDRILSRASVKSALFCCVLFATFCRHLETPDHWVTRKTKEPPQIFLTNQLDGWRGGCDCQRISSRQWCQRNRIHRDWRQMSAENHPVSVQTSVQYWARSFDVFILLRAPHRHQVVCFCLP